MSYVDPSVHWSITVQKYASGYTHVDVEYDNIGLVNILKVGVNAIPGGVLFDYANGIEVLSGKITSWTDGKGGLVDYYTYTEDMFYEKFKDWGTDLGIANDIADTIFNASEKASVKITGSLAKNSLRMPVQ